MEHEKERLKKFLFRFFRKHELQDDEDIFALGFANSLFAMQLVTFLETEFGIHLENEDLEFANFRSINTILKLVEAKLQVTGGAQ